MLKNARTIIFASILALACHLSANAQQTFRGQVVDIVDGRTVLMQGASGKLKVELQFIDVPVAGQQMYDTVLEHLRSLVMGKPVEYRPRNILGDHTIGRLTVNTVDVSQQMLRDGAAWHMPVRLTGQDSDEFQIYASTEAMAKDEKRGLWSVTDLRPPWEREDVAVDPYTGKAIEPVSSNRTGSAVKPRGPWSDKDPKLGNIGALLSGYNAEGKTGYVATPMVNVEGTSHELGSEINLALGVIYYYRQTENGRKGVFGITLVSTSRKMLFLAKNDLWLIGAGKSLNLGKPKRTVSEGFDHNREQLTYTVSKSVIERIVNNDYVVLRVGDQMIQAQGARYLLYNMLQIAD